MTETRNREQIAAETLCAPCHGTLISLAALADPVIRSREHREGFAVEPSDPAEGDIVSPVDGTVLEVRGNGQSVTVRSAEGLKILVQTGTGAAVSEGEGIHGYVRTGDSVHRGERLLHADLGRIRRRGCGTACLVLLCDPSEAGVLRFRVREGTQVRGGQSPVLTAELRRAEETVPV